MKRSVFTIGHSTHSIERFVGLLRQHEIVALADVRSSPYSKFNPQFNRESLQESLRTVGIRYVFLGKELGARSDDPACYEHGKVQYDRLAETRLFRSGIDRVMEGAESYLIALMCAEKDPLQCHRTILVSRELVRRGLEVKHILSDGSIESHPDSIRRLKAELRLPPADFFRSEEDVERESYARQAELIAYDRSGPGSSDEDETVLKSGEVR